MCDAARYTGITALQKILVLTPPTAVAASWEPGDDSCIDRGSTHAAPRLGEQLSSVIPVCRLGSTSDSSIQEA
jgi:hypothetical protein